SDLLRGSRAPLPRCLPARSRSRLLRRSAAAREPREHPPGRGVHLSARARAVLRRRRAPARDAPQDGGGDRSPSRGRARDAGRRHDRERVRGFGETLPCRRRGRDRHVEHRSSARAAMSARGARPRVKRSVVRRVLWSYAFVVAAFAVVAGWSALALRSAAREASLMRAGYYPLALAVRDLVAKQDTYNSQLNHITAARNPADLRVWFDFALRIGRPKLFGEVRTAIGRAFLASGDPDTRRVGSELLAEVGAIERLFKDDGERLSRLFSALERGDSALAERLRDEAVTRGSQGSTRLGRLELRVEREVDLLLDQARFRERFALKLLILLSTIGLLVGLLMALYTRRVLLPLGLVTERAKAVASGDLEP